MYKKTKIIIITSLIICLTFPNFIIANNTSKLDNSINTSNTSNVNNETSNLPTINSRAAVVIERSTNTILFAKNENEQRKMASTTKIMTAVIVLENADLSQTIEVSSKAAGTGGSRLGLKKNAKITINDLLYGLLLCSGNDAAIALAEYVGGDVPSFAKLMNNKAKELGLNNTNFVTPHGLDEDNHYTTAYELALLTNYALQNETFLKIVGTKNYTVTINGYPKNITNTNELLGSLSGVYGVKTGFTNGANRCLVSSCKRDNLDIICVVLGADTKNNRTQDSIKLIEYTFDNFKMVNINKLITDKFINWTSTMPNFTIHKGTSNNVTPKLEKLTFDFFPINKNNIDNIKIYINCDYCFEAPLLENHVIGTLSCNINDNTIFKFNIYNSCTITKKNTYNYFINLSNNFIYYLENSLL